MDKSAWVDAFLCHMSELGTNSIKLGELAETLWPHLGTLDPKKVAKAEQILWDAAHDGFPDTEFGPGR